MVNLNAVEQRVVGALMEKEMTTPEYYPLSLNALVNACNQKSSRDPVMELGEADVRTALFDLEQLSLARTLGDGRVSKFEHRMRDQLNLRRDETAVICLLLLRGAQTAAELRTRAERMHTFDDTLAATSTLERLAAREEPMVVLLPKAPGAREARWAHLLGGPVEGGVSADASASSHVATAAVASPELTARIAALEETVSMLETRLKVLEDCGAFRPQE